MKDDNMKMSEEEMAAKQDVLEAIKKLADELMLEGMDEDEAVVAELDIQKVDSDEAADMMEEAMEGEMPEMPEMDEEDMMEEDEEDESSESMLKKALKKKSMLA
jgi:hypothetical protein